MDEAVFLLAYKLCVAACLGGIAGSFITMLAYRLPRRLSIITPRSHCPACKTPLGMADLVPVFSYLLSRGRCRHCGTTISRRYVLIELFCVALAVALACGL